MSTLSRCLTVAAVALATVVDIAAPAKGYASLTRTPGYALTPNDQVNGDKP